MEFLPIPEGCERLTLEIPYLATLLYDNGGLERFPERSGWSVRSRQEWRAIFHDPLPPFRGFLQTWLILTPLQLTFGDGFPMELLRKDGVSGNKVFDTTELKKWLSRHPTFIPDDKKSKTVGSTLHYILQLHVGLSSAHSITDEESKMYTLAEYIQYACIEDPRDPSTILLTATILETLFEYFLTAICKSEGIQFPGFGGVIGGLSVLTTRNNLLLKQMRIDGWCPHDLKVLSTRLNTAGHYFMRHLQRQHTDRTHKVIHVEPRGDHRSQRTDVALNVSSIHSQPLNDLCTYDHCYHFQLNDTSYKTKHVEQCDRSSCFDMVADPQKVSAILRAGEIPLVLSIDAEDKSTDLHIIPSGSNSEHHYVAISHVWSDGLGNVERSALPRCQVLRLSTLIRNLPGEASNMVLFWIDTIGCPPDQADCGEIQLLAIQKMYETYAHANAVLVLESSVQKKKCKSIPDYQNLMEVVSSSWNSRLWTLQEGALAKPGALYFQFLDGAYNVDKGLSSFENNRDPIVDLTLKTTICEKIFEIRQFVGPGVTLPQKLLALRAALAERSTSVDTDEPLCIAALLGLPQVIRNKITQTEPSQRMGALWDALDEIPSTCLTDKTPRLGTDGKSWAPKSLLQSSRGIVTATIKRMDESLTVKKTAEGLRMSGFGILLSVNKLVGKYFFVKDGRDRFFELAPDLMGVHGTTEINVTGSFAERQYNTPITRESLNESCVYETTVKLNSPDERYVLCFIANGDPSYTPDAKFEKGATSGFFARLEGYNDGVIIAKYLFPGSCVYFRKPAESIYRDLYKMHLPKWQWVGSHAVVPLSCVYDESGIMRMASAHANEPEQKWLIR
ncbi:hypothetical protein PTT_12128 [Pyrenophora teres f. teres 0-1]|uniref:Heterokaryon incompatibility domain-containing protein n=2 Tax=Pyrenophora teres f. teres TaxID=97479 RepID=E3RT25_PYRTT|nr:hypothetical protein PTT_12128 [Pyrenophora teres f. teres 0-1]KAE8857450.1 hypothetical protein PTNB29_08517 [Pyrenophora teres f. teres]